MPEFFLAKLFSEIRRNDLYWVVAWSGIREPCDSAADTRRAQVKVNCGDNADRNPLRGFFGSRKFSDISTLSMIFITER
jgi:hypothetical protein